MVQDLGYKNMYEYTLLVYAQIYPLEKKKKSSPTSFLASSPLVILVGCLATAPAAFL